MDEVKLKFTVEGAKALEATKKQQDEIKRLEKLWDDATDAERKYAAQTQKISAGKLANTDIGALTEGWRAAGAQVAKVGASFAGIAAASVAVAAEAEKQDAALQRLGSAYDAVSIATNGAFSAQQALLLQGQIQASGVRVNTQQLALLTRAAREYALATGNDASQAVEKLTNAIVNNSEDALSELGLAQARATTSTQTLANMTRLLEERFRGTSPAARTLNEDLARLPDVLTRIGNAAAQVAIGGLQRFIDAANGAGTAARMWRDIVEQPDTDRQVARQQATDNNQRLLQDRRQAVLNRLNRAGVSIPESLRERLGYGLNRADDRELTALTRALDQSARQGTGPVRTGEAAFGFDANFNTGRALNDATNSADYGFARAARESFGLMNAAIEEEQRKRAPATNRVVRELDLMKEKLNDASHATETAGHAMARVARAASGPRSVDELFQQLFGDRTRENPFANALHGSLASDLGVDRATNDGALFDEIAAAQDGGGLVARESRSRRSRLNQRDRETRTQALRQDRSVGGGLLRGLGVNGDALETEAKLSQGYADTIVGAYSKVSDAITKHIELVASGQETIGQAMLNGVHEITKALAMEAFPKALMETAAGLAALANPITAPTAPLHFTAAAVYGSVAAGAGLVAGVTGALGAGQSAGAGAGARATGSARAASGASSSGSQENAPPVNIYLSSIVPPGPRELQSLVAAGAQAGRYNLDRRRDMIPRQVRA